MKKLMLFFLWIVFCLPLAGVQAQSTEIATDASCTQIIHFTQQYKRFEMGIAAGATLNKLYTQTIRSLSKYEREAGVSISIPMLCRITDWWAFEWELSGIQKNYYWKHGSFGYQTTYNSYLQLPIMQRFSFGAKRFKVFVNLGGFGGYLFNRWESGRLLNVYDQSNYYSYSENCKFDSRRDQRFEFGVLAGAGMEFLSKERYRFFAEVRYHYGLTDLQQKNYMLNQIPRYNNTFLFQMGCLFRFKSKKVINYAKQTDNQTESNIKMETQDSIMLTEMPQLDTEQDTILISVPIVVHQNTIVSNDEITEVIDYQKVDETQDEQDSIDMQCVLEKGYYVQLFALKFRRTISYVRRVAPVLEEDTVIECQKDTFYVYLVGAFPTIEEAEEKLKHYKQQLRGAFIVIKK